MDVAVDNIVLSARSHESINKLRRGYIYIYKAQPYTPPTGIMQLVHNGEGLYCLHPPSSEQAKRTFFNLPTQEETSPFKF